jgi:hypothetical protein
VARELTEEFIAGTPAQDVNGTGNGRGHTAVSATEPVTQPVTTAAD